MLHLTLIWTLNLGGGPRLDIEFNMWFVDHLSAYYVKNTQKVLSDSKMRPGPTVSGPYPFLLLTSCLPPHHLCLLFL